jgi:PTS system fructose-specific IIC component
MLDSWADLIAGFLAGYIMVYLKKAFKGLPRTLDGMKTILLYPVFGLLITGLLMYFLVGPVFSTINTAMITFLENLGTGNAVLLGAVLGGMMAIDMGGPFNKAAYAFSIGIFTDTGDGSLMAAVMAGGMIPPLAIGIATLLFKTNLRILNKNPDFPTFCWVCPSSLKVRSRSLQQIRCVLSVHPSLVQRLRVV